MQRIIVVTLILAVLCTYTIVQGDNIQDEVKITVTADKKMSFDMFQTGKPVAKGLTTPYELKFSRTDSHFIFKAQKSRTRLNIKVEINNQTTLTANWPITVLIVTNSSFSTFGME